MKLLSFTNSESTFLSKLNEGHATFEELKSVVPYSDKTLKQVIESLISKKIIKLDTSTGRYVYDSPVNGEKIILDGNLMLPTTILKFKDRMLVSRGTWYQFPPDFDIRRVIWNVQLPMSKKQNSGTSTLVELIRESVLKEKKSRIIQSTDTTYKGLVNKIVPYGKSIALKLNVVGDDQCDVSIMFKKLVNKITDDIKIEFRGLTVRSEISTHELIAELKKPVKERDYSNVKLNRMFNFSDFVFLNNEIPYQFDIENKILYYVKITKVRGTIELTYQAMKSDGDVEKIEVTSYEDAADGIAKIKELFMQYAVKMVDGEDFYVEDLNLEHDGKSSK